MPPKRDAIFDGLMISENWVQVAQPSCWAQLAGERRNGNSDSTETMKAVT